MRSFLSIFSRRIKFPNAESFTAKVGLDSFDQAGNPDPGFTSDSILLKSSKNNPFDAESCIIETNQYIIQYDIRIDKDHSGKWDIRGLFNNEVVKKLFTHPESVNDLPIFEFHLLIWDKLEKRLIAFRDQIGVWPLYYYVDEDWLIFSTDIVLIRSLGAVNVRINQEWIADLLVNLHSEGMKTFYGNIHLVEPGHVLIGDLKSQDHLSYYRLIDNLQEFDYKQEEALDNFRIILSNAIEKRIVNFPSTGSELSGGLDSSAIVGLAYPIAQQRGIDFHTFSNVLPEKERNREGIKADESYFGSMLIRETGVKNHHQLSGEDLGILGELKSNLKFIGMPSQQLFTMFSDEIYHKVSGLGIPQLLSGFGGDECISHNGSGFLEEMANNERWDIFLRETITQHKSQDKTILRSYLKYIAERYIPYGSDLLYSMKSRNQWKRNKIKGFGFDQEFGRKMKIESRYISRKGARAEPSVMLTQYRRLTQPYLSRRLIGSYHAGVRYGFDYSFPLLDKELLEFHLSLPATYKYNKGNGRIFLREVLKGFVPDPIRLRNDKQGAVIPTVHNRLLRDEKNIRVLIEKSKESNKYHYLDYQKLSYWLEAMVRRENKKGIYLNPNGFYNSLQILLLQEMERTGEFKTGIYN